MQLAYAIILARRDMTLKRDVTRKQIKWVFVITTCDCYAELTTWRLVSLVGGPSRRFLNLLYPFCATFLATWPAFRAKEGLRTQRRPNVDHRTPWIDPREALRPNLMATTIPLMPNMSLGYGCKAGT